MPPQEQKQPEEKKPSKWGIRISNILKSWLKRIGFDRAIQNITGETLKYELYEGQSITDIQTVREELKQRGDLLNLMENHSQAVVRIENFWDQFDKFIASFEDIYAQSMIYIDSTTAKWEYPQYETPRDISNDPLVDVEIKGGVYYYPVPPIRKVRYPIVGMKREWVVNISPFGYRNAGAYIERYQEIIEEICNNFEATTVANERDPNLKKNISSRVGIIKKVYQEMISHVMLAYCGSEESVTTALTSNPQIERRYRGFVKTAGEISANIEGGYSRMDALRVTFSANNIMYYNTHNIINPILYGEREKNAEVIDRLDNPTYNWQLRGDEIEVGLDKYGVGLDKYGVGLDKYGYPLEVDEQGYVMIDKRGGDGNPTPRNTWRKVPNKFIKKVDLIEMANYLANMHDTYRDDLRDGRFHPGTATIMDYVEANNRSIWDLWRLKDENEIPRGWVDRNTGERKYITEFPINLTRAIDGITTFPYKVKATDKNPAFDFRYLGANREQVDWKHAGRKYYYEVPDGTMSSKNMEPHISSRGISMYIIEKVTRQIGQWNQVMSILNEVGTRGGFDYGTRPWDMWGKEMPSSIFEWRNILDRINKPIPVEMTEEQFVEKYKITH